MESSRYLKCLGMPALFSAAGEPIRFRTKKHLALLVYLAVEIRQQHHREHLADLLWPKVESAERHLWVVTGKLLSSGQLNLIRARIRSMPRGIIAGLTNALEQIGNVGARDQSNRARRKFVGQQPDGQLWLWDDLWRDAGTFGTSICNSSNQPVRPAMRSTTSMIAQT